MGDTKFQRVAIIAALSLFIFGTVAALLPRPVRAGTEGAGDGTLNLITSPLPISLVTNPGTTTTTELKVKNGGTRTEKLRIDLYKFAAFGEEGKPRLLDPEPGDEYFKWVTFSETVFNAEPNEWKTIKMTINVPKSAAFGYYYAAAFSRADKEKVTGDRRTGLQGSIATLVLLEARVPNAKRHVEVLEFSSDKRIYEFLPASFTLKLKNGGNVHVAPRGNIFITRGKENLGTVEVNQERGNLLPASNRNFQAEWTEGFPFYKDKEENGKVVTNRKNEPVKVLNWDFNQLSKFRFGKYTANLLLVYDDGQRDIPIEATVSFWVIPWRYILIILFVLGLVGVGMFTVVKNLRQQVGGRPKRK